MIASEHEDTFFFLDHYYLIIRKFCENIIYIYIIYIVVRREYFVSKSRKMRGKIKRGNQFCRIFEIDTKFR